jgi:hypothetical protein
MIQPNELRIGNWVGHDASWSVVNEKEKEGIVFQWQDYDFAHVTEGTMSYDSLLPIPLTPEILEKCGFVPCHPIKNFPQYTDYRLETVVINYHPDWGFCEFEFGRKDVEERAYLCKVKHLHQLQNLYFALTGTELNYKP